MLRKLALFALVLAVEVPAEAQRYGGGEGRPARGSEIFNPTGPSAPAYFGVGLVNPHTSTELVRAGWYNTSTATRAVLYRGPSNVGPFTAVNAVDANYASGTNSTIIDPAPLVDASACYKVAVSDSYGDTWSPAACIFTSDRLGRPLWRAQLRVTVATVSDAGANAAVAVRLNSPAGSIYSPNGNETWVDTPADDFESGSVRDYELLVNRLSDVSDVKMVSLVVEGDDPLCVRGVELLLNEEPAFATNFGNATCRWVSASTPLRIDHPALRASPLWQNFTSDAVAGAIEYEMLDSIVTATVGDFIHGTGNSFNDEQSPSTSNVQGTIRVYRYGMETAVGSDFELEIQLRADTTCEAGDRQVAHVYVEEVDADASGFVEYLVLPLAEALTEVFEPDVPNLFRRDVDLGTCSADWHLCFTPTALRARGGGCSS